MAVSDGEIVARSLLLLRGIRGKDGVAWAANFILQHLKTLAHDFTGFCHEFVRDFLKETQRRGKATWAGHNEGRNIIIITLLLITIHRHRRPPPPHPLPGTLPVLSTIIVIISAQVQS